MARFKNALDAYKNQSEPQGPLPRATVGYWDKTHWVLFGAAHGLRWDKDPNDPNIDPNVTEAVATVTLSFWPDPPIGSGPP